mgnify:FL=1
MTFKKTSLHTWEALSKNITYYIDLETFNGEGNMYYLTILDGNVVLENGLSFFKLNSAKQYAKQY